MSGPTSPTSQGGGDLPTMSEAQQLAQALIVAAQNAASASAVHTTLFQQLMTQLSAQNSGGAPVAPSSTAKFAHASKMVRMPDPFTAVGAEAEQTAWPDFELNLLAWLGAADTGFETDLQWISDHVDTEFDMDVHSDEMATRSKELHSILVGLLRNRSLKVLRGVSGRNGYEVYRQLLKLFKPSTKPRAMALLSALMGLPTFGKDKSLYDHMNLSISKASCAQGKTTSHPYPAVCKILNANRYSPPGAENENLHCQGRQLVGTGHLCLVKVTKIWQKQRMGNQPKWRELW